MKQILPNLKELNKHLKFVKKSVSGAGFRHIQQYLDGLITLNHKTVKRISEASIEENHHSGISRILAISDFEAGELENRYLKKIKFILKGHKKYLLFDDTLNIREGKSVEETQYHHDHNSNSFVKGHQYFTSMIFTEYAQFPLFPKLYSCNTDNKIEMAKDIVDKAIESIGIYGVLFDSWYSDKKIMNKCIAKGVKVICAIKTNRKVSFRRGEWLPLAKFSKNQTFDENTIYLIDDEEFIVNEYLAKLKSMPDVKLIISRIRDRKSREFHSPFHLISTDKNDTIVNIIREYSYRWNIETFHRDIKQNLGFASCMARKKEVIVSHSILVVIAYAILKLFMFFRGLTMTIGECCKYIQDNEMNNFIQEIVEIEDRAERMEYFQRVFKRETAKV